MTPLDFFFWGAVKDKSYANHPETIEALKHEIEVAIHGIEVQTIENILKNWVDRMGYCKASRGSHLNDVVFHSYIERFNLSNETIILFSPKRYEYVFYFNTWFLDPRCSEISPSVNLIGCLTPYRGQCGCKLYEIDRKYKDFVFGGLI